MRSHPFFNALGAIAYIGLIALFIHHLSALRHDTPDTLLDSMGALSLFACSAAVLAFLFFYQPARLLADGKQKEAAAYFVKTLAAFGLMTALVLALATAQ